MSIKQSILIAALLAVALSVETDEQKVTPISDESNDDPNRRTPDRSGTASLDSTDQSGRPTECLYPARCDQCGVRING